MIRSNSIPSSSRNTVEPTVPLLLHIGPCISYARPVSTKIRPKTNNEKSKNLTSDSTDLFTSGKASIYEKSTASSMLTSNSTTSRISYSTAELNRFKNSLIKNSFNKKIKKADNFWTQSSSVFSSPNLASLSTTETPRQIKSVKKTPESLPLAFIYDPLQYSSMINVSKAAEFNIFRNKLIKNQPHFRQPSTFIVSNFFSHLKDSNLNTKRDTNGSQSVNYRLKKLY